MRRCFACPKPLLQSQVSRQGNAWGIFCCYNHQHRPGNHPLQDKIVFRLGPGAKVEIERLPMSLEEAYGSVAPLGNPQDLEAIRQTAQEEREELWVQRLRDEP